MNNIGLTKKEIADISKYEPDFIPGKIIDDWEECRGKDIHWLIVVSRGNKEKHDSGYPFIIVIAKGKDGNYYHLGWHDHYICDIPVNVDSYGKNIFRVFPWGRIKNWSIYKHFVPVSTLEIGDSSGYGIFAENAVR